MADHQDDAANVENGADDAHGKGIQARVNAPSDEGADGQKSDDEHKTEELTGTADGGTETMPGSGEDDGAR